MADKNMTYTYHPDDNPLQPRDPRGCFQAVLAGIAIAALFVTCVLLSSCASTKTVTQIEYRDSLRTEYLHDTCYLQVHDTTYVEVESKSEQSEHTDIEFADGGGSVVLDSIGNLLRIENIRNMRLSKQEKEQAQTIIRQAEEIEAYKSRNDSLTKALRSQTIMGEQQRNTEDIKPKTSGWHRFLVWWFIITAGILLAFAAYKGWKIYRRIAVGI